MVYRSQVSHCAYFKDFNSKLKVFFFTGFKECSMIWNKLYITGISKPNINTFFWLKHQDTTIMVSCINEENMEISE